MAYKIMQDGKLKEVEVVVQADTEIGHVVETERGYNQNLFYKVVNRFRELISLINFDAPIYDQDVIPHVFANYVKQHIESHGVVPDLYMQHIVDMSWEKFVAEYVRDAAKIAKDIAFEREKTGSMSVTEESDQGKTKGKKIVVNVLAEEFKAKAENKKLKAVIEAQKLLDLLTKEKHTALESKKVSAIIQKLQLAGSQQDLTKEEKLPNIKYTATTKGRKPTPKQILEEAYKQSSSAREFLGQFDTQFLLKNEDAIRTFASSKMNSEDFKELYELMSELYIHGDLNMPLYRELTTDNQVTM